MLLPALGIEPICKFHYNIFWMKPRIKIYHFKDPGRQRGSRIKIKKICKFTSCGSLVRASTISSEEDVQAAKCKGVIPPGPAMFGMKINFSVLSVESIIEYRMSKSTILWHLLLTALFKRWISDSICIDSIANPCRPKFSSRRMSRRVLTSAQKSRSMENIRRNLNRWTL